MKVISQTRHECPCCHNLHKNRSKAAECLSRHTEGFGEKCPSYAVGKLVITRRFNDPNYGEEKTLIIATRGSFLHLELLVENQKRERYWVPAVRYQTSDFEKDPAPFHFVKIDE